MSDKQSRLATAIMNLVNSIIELVLLCKPKRGKKEDKEEDKEEETKE